MAVEGCGIVCKYILFLFNIIFAVVGLAFLGLGLWLRFSDGTRGIFNVEEFNSSAFVIIVTVLIALGAVMLIVVVFGDYGACNEKRCALQTFSVLVAFLALAEVILGVVIFSNRDQFGKMMGEFYGSLYGLYISNQDPVIAITLTFTHQMLHCCGMTGVSIVEIVKETCPKPSGIMEHLVMPNCPGTIEGYLNQKASLVMGVFLGIGTLLIAALICSIILLKQVKEDYEAFKRYRSAVF